MLLQGLVYDLLARRKSYISSFNSSETTTETSSSTDYASLAFTNYTNAIHEKRLTVDSREWLAAHLYLAKLHLSFPSLQSPQKKVKPTAGKGTRSSASGPVSSGKSDDVGRELQLHTALALTTTVLSSKCCVGDTLYIAHFYTAQLHIELVSLLLDSSADVDTPSQLIQSQLKVSSSQPSPEVIQKLHAADRQLCKTLEQSQPACDNSDHLSLTSGSDEYTFQRVFCVLKAYEVKQKIIKYDRELSDGEKGPFRWVSASLLYELLFSFEGKDNVNIGFICSYLLSSILIQRRALQALRCSCFALLSLSTILSRTLFMKPSNIEVLTKKSVIEAGSRVQLYSLKNVTHNGAVAIVVNLPETTEDRCTVQLQSNGQMIRVKMENVRLFAVSVLALIGRYAAKLTGSSLAMVTSLSIWATPTIVPGASLATWLLELTATSSTASPLIVREQRSVTAKAADDEVQIAPAGIRPPPKTAVPVAPAGVRPPSSSAKGQSITSPIGQVSPVGDTFSRRSRVEGHGADVFASRKDLLSLQSSAISAGARLTLLLMMRLSRIRLFIQSKQWEAIHGRRAVAEMKEMSTETAAEFRKHANALIAECQDRREFLSLTELLDMGEIASYVALSPQDRMNYSLGHYETALRTRKFLGEITSVPGVRKLSSSRACIPGIGELLGGPRSLNNEDDAGTGSGLKDSLSGYKKQYEQLNTLAMTLNLDCGGDDASTSGVRMFERLLLSKDDILLVIHCVEDSQAVRVVLVWYETDQPPIGSPEAKSPSPQSPFSPDAKKAKSASHYRLRVEATVSEAEGFADRLMVLVVRYVEALKARSTGLLSDVLKDISALLALSELLVPVVENRRTDGTVFESDLVICCSPLLRILPWHALTVDGASFTVSSGSLNRQGAGAASTVPLGQVFNVRQGPSLALLPLLASQQRAHGRRGKAKSVAPVAEKICFIEGDRQLSVLSGSRVEIEAVASVWSGSKSQEEMTNCDVITDTDATKSRLMQSPNVSHASLVDSTVKETEQSTYEETEDDRQRALCISECRVLHICAGAIYQTRKDTSTSVITTDFGLALTPIESLTENSESDILSTRDIVQSLHLNNCSLTILSRTDICANLLIDKNEMSRLEWEYNGLNDIIDAFHLAGACTVMYPLWSCELGGRIGMVANILLLVRVYWHLKGRDMTQDSAVEVSKPKTQVSSAVRMAQMWLRNASVANVLEFLSTADLSESVVEGIQGELADVPSDTLLFFNALYWAAFAVSGTGATLEPDVPVVSAASPVTDVVPSEAKTSSWAPIAGFVKAAAVGAKALSKMKNTDKKEQEEGVSCPPDEKPIVAESKTTTIIADTDAGQKAVITVKESKACVIM